MAMRQNVEELRDQGKVSADRITLYLQDDEIQLDAVSLTPKDESEVSVQIDSGRISWDNDARRVTLDEISLQNCLMGILKDKTIVYVTHQVEFLPAADIILVMENGRIAQAGTFEELLKHNVGFELFVGAHNQALEIHFVRPGTMSRLSEYILFYSFTFFFLSEALSACFCSLRVLDLDILCTNGGKTYWDL